MTAFDGAAWSAATGPAHLLLRPPRFSVAFVAALAAAGFFALYAARLCPDLCLIADSAELVTAAALWGVPHAPGYPLFTAVGHLFAVVPIHSLPWRVHLTSAVFHAGAVAATVSATFAITRSRVAALAAGFSLGVSRSFLLGSLYAEVFPLNDLLFACLFAIALHLLRAGDGPARLPLLAFAACAGLASANHMTIVLGAPALAILVARPACAYARASAAHFLELLAAFLLPLLLSYALVPLAASRSPWLSWGNVHDARSFVQLVTRQDYGGLFSPAKHASTEAGLVRLEAFRRLMVRSIGEITLAGAAWGVIAQWRRSTAIGASLVLAIALPGPGFALVNALDTSSPEALAIFERFTTMCHVPVAIALGAGLNAIRSAIGSSRAAHAAGALALLGWSAFGTRRAADVDLSNDRSPAAFAHDLVFGTPDRALVLLSGDEPAGAALYVCAVERQCGDRIVLSPGNLSLPWKMAEVRTRYPDLAIPWSGGPALPRTHELIALQARKRPALVYPDLLNKDPAIRTSFDVLPDGLLFRVWPPGSEEASERAAFVASARALTTGDREWGRSRGSTFQESQIARIYEAALLNHARVARLLAAQEGAPRGADLYDLARRLEERARVSAQGGDESMSR